MKSASRNVASIRGKSASPELEVIIEAAGNAFVLYDADGAIRLASQRLGPLLHLQPCEKDSLGDFSAFSRILARRLSKGRRKVRPPWVLWQAGTDFAREQLELGEGRRIIERTVRPVLDGSGRVTGWVERYRDSTSEHELPARLLQTEKLAALGQMVAGVTHELNNPLTTIMGYGHLLLERPLDPKSLADANRICQESERAARIVRNLLMLAREAKLERAAVNLNEIVERTLRLCAYDLQRVGIHVEADLDPRLPHTLVNPVQLQQVVLNLLVNSQQAIATAAERPGRIVLRTRQDDGRVFLHIEDNGPGVASDIQSRIFEPFFTTKPVGVGTGLGLSIVTGILRQHGAEIELTETSEEGTTFTVSLPVADHRSDPSQDETPGAGRSVCGRRILVLESEPSVGRLIVDALTKTGHQVEWADSGKDALERFQESEYDLIVCEEKMRGLDGREIYVVLSEEGELESDRLLLIGSKPTSRRTSEFFRECPPAFLAKPFQLSELKDAVTKLLLKHEPAETAPARSPVETT